MVRFRPGAAAVLVASGIALARPGAAAPAGPVQPVPFSHRVHATDAAIGCTSCHVYAERGPVAGVPSMARCQGCHKFVKEDPEHPQLDAQLKPFVKLLRDGKPIEWVRVTRLPDHVYFTHERHVRAGVRCQECHGEVEKMEAVRQVAPLTMGWCLECHHRKQREKPGERRKLTECVTCHK
ncbi:cytochrome c3 family protein [Anaeromyxobacter oryzae]|uniref:Class III cytochrome C domain protein n=1 Tax=Anaeromyxobacter oryzae TaxID=2918170 RepID=A0ABM7X175_9BACT|nr:cytochrome c3 family protein [Anaeromyxobacter oryzae]BDG05540.1 class III cytochrome C domain protein [Anaeromyxobacter oryzae]